MPWIEIDILGGDFESKKEPETQKAPVPDRDRGRETQLQLQLVVESITVDE